MNVSCIPKSGCCCFFIPLFFIFLSLQFSNFKIFVTLFSGTVRPTRLKVYTHVDNEWFYRVYRNQAAALYLSLYFFIFLSNFQTFKISVMFFSGTVRLKLGTHVDNGWQYRVYRNQAAVAYSFLYFFHFFLSIFIFSVSPIFSPYM